MTTPNNSTEINEVKKPHITEYTHQLVTFADLPFYEGWGVAFASWLLLAGFVVFPGTFTNLKQLNLSGQPFGAAGEWIIGKIQNLPLLGVACLCSGLGAIGLLLFWVRWRRNWLAITEKVFLPGVMQGSMGVLTTVINVYTAQDHTWSIMARVSVCVEGGCFVICGCLFIFYRVLIGRMKKAHDKEMEAHKDDYKQSTSIKMVVGKGDQYDEEEKSIERRLSNGEQSLPVKDKKTPSRKSTARSTSERTIQESAAVAPLRRFSELKVAADSQSTPVAEEKEEVVGHEEHPDVILTPRRPTIDHSLTGATQVNDQTPTREQVQDPTEHQHQEAKAI